MKEENFQKNRIYVLEKLKKIEKKKNDYEIIFFYFILVQKIQFIEHVFRNAKLIKKVILK